MSDNETNDTTEMETHERGTGRPVSSRRDLPPHKGIEVRIQNAERGNAGHATQHGNVLGDGDPNRPGLTIEAVGNASKTLYSDHSDGDSTILGGESSTAIAIRQRETIVGAYERGSAAHLEAQARRAAETDEERVARIRRARAINSPASMVAPDITTPSSPRPSPVKREA